LNIKEKFYILLELPIQKQPLSQITGWFIVILICLNTKRGDVHLQSIIRNLNQLIQARRVTRKPFRMLDIFLRWMRMI